MVHYNVYKNGELQMENATATEISKATGYKKRYIAMAVNTYGGYCRNLYIEKTRDSLSKHEILEFEWEIETNAAKERLKNEYKGRNIVTASARGYR